jgi:hypothetical protein
MELSVNGLKLEEEVLLAKQKQKNMIDFEKTPLGQIPSQ